MADYTVTLQDWSPGMVIARYDITTMPVTITLSDLPREPMELLFLRLYFEVLDPSNVTYWDLALQPSFGPFTIAKETELSLSTGPQYILLYPQAPHEVVGELRLVPLPPLLLSRSTRLTWAVDGTLDTDYQAPRLYLAASYGSPRRVDDLITRTTYRDADGYIIS